MNETDILKWAAGANIELPRFDGVNDDRILYLLGIDEEKLIHLIGEHRLAARFLARLKQGRPGWCSRTLLAGVLNLGAQTEQRLKRQINAIQEISRALADEERPVIIVKGCSPYALTGDTRHFRASYDLDVFYSDPEYLEKMLLNLGYTGKRHPEADHEFATMSRDEINIEIHRCFPIWSYPQDICPPDLIPPCNHGCWVQALTNRVQTVVQYADLLENSCHGVTPDTADLTVTDPCMCVFLLCVHAFRHYIEPPPKHLIAVQLGVLASIYELCQLPQFDKQQFEAFIDRFAGHDSVRFIGQLSAHFFGSDPLASAASQPAAQSGLASVDGWRCLPFPRSLTLFGCWACLNSADELLLPYDMAAVNQALVANTVVGTHEPARMRYSVFDDSVGEPISRMIVQAVEKRFIPFAFSVTWSKEALLFDVCILESLQKDHTYCLEIQDGVIKWQGTQLGEWPGGDGSGCVSLLENGCRFQVAFPWNVVWQQGRKSACKPFMLTLTKWPDTASYLWTAVLEAADPVITVPLNIIREP